MKHYLLQPAQREVCLGFTDLFIITHEDLEGNTTDDLASAVTLDALAFGDVVGYEAMIEVVEALNAPSANATITVSLGVTSALTQIIGASTVVNSGTPSAAKTTFVSAAAGAPYPVPSGGKDLIANIDIDDADGALADLTSGEIWIWCKILRESTRRSFLA